MDNKEFDKRVDELNEELLAEPTEAAESNETVQVATPTDFYQKNRSGRLSDAKKHTFPRGSRQKVALATKAVLERLAPAYRVAKGDSDYLRSIGDKQRAAWREQQYLEDDFLPAVESVVNFSSADELLNSKESLSLLDKYAMLNNMSGGGFTTAFVKSLHADDRGAFSGQSDGYVMDCIGRIHKLLDEDNIRAAISLANKLQKQIDNGDYLASEDDYQYVVKITSRG